MNTPSATRAAEVDLGAADAFPIDTFRVVEVNGREIGVLRRADGSVHAIRNWCPHKGARLCTFPPTGTMLPGPPGTLEWGRDGEIVRCPWHGFEFELATGKRPYSDSRMRLRVYPARIENGGILIDMSPQRSSATSRED